MAGDKERLKRRIARLVIERDTALAEAERLRALATQTLQLVQGEGALAPWQVVDLYMLAIAHLRRGLT